MILDEIIKEEEFEDYLKDLSSQDYREKMRVATKLALTKRDLAYLRIMGVTKEDAFYKDIKVKINWAILKEKKVTSMLSLK